MVLMAKSPEAIHRIVAKIVTSIRQFSLRINEKTKLRKLNDTKPIEERLFSGDYAFSWSQTSREKVNKYRKEIPKIIRKIKKGDEVNKKEIANLRYFLKATKQFESRGIVEGLIDCIPLKPSLTEDIVRFLGSHFVNYRLSRKTTDKEIYIKNRCFKIWKVYKNNELTEWTRFWLIKALLQKEFIKNSSEFRKEISVITKNKDSKFLKLIGYFYFAYLSNDSKPNFSFNELRSQIHNANNEIEKSSFLYFLIYFNGIEDQKTIFELALDGLSSKSIEIQLMSIFVLKKLGWKSKKAKNYGLFTKRLLNITIDKDEEDLLPKQEVKEDDYLTFEGKINPRQFSRFMGTATRGPKKYAGNEKIKKITFVRDDKRSDVSLFYVNDDISHVKKIQNPSKKVRKLAQISLGKEFLFDKDTHDYLNTNRKCTLYGNGKYQLTNIIDGHGKNLKINKNIKIEIIDKSTLKRRQGKRPA